MGEILKGLSLIVAVLGIILAPIALLSVWLPTFGLFTTAVLYKLYITFFILFSLLATLALSAHISHALFNQRETSSKNDGREAA